MPSTTPYTFWLRGSDSFASTDTNSESTTTPADNFPTSIGEPTVPNGWIAIGAYAADPQDIDEGGSYTTPGGERYDTPLTREQFTLDIERYGFTSEMSDYDALRTHLRKRYLYIAVSSYPYTIHAANRCIAVSRTYESIHTHSNGTKTIRITLQRRKPYA